MRRLSGAVLGAVLVAVVGFPGPAAAHVTVDPAGAVQGGYARVVFRVPNERDSASVTKLAVRFPDEHPVPGVRTMPVPGWNVTVKTRSLEQPLDRHGVRVDTVVSELIWTASPGKTAIPPGQFLEFPVSMGPLPETLALAFTALQTYSGGDTVTWGEVPSATAEPEHPAPVLALAKAPTRDPGVPTAAAGGPTAPAGRGEDNSGGTPLWLGGLALLAGLIGLVLGVVALRRTRDTGGWADFDELDESDELDEEVGGEPSGEQPDDEQEPPPPPPRRPSPRPQTPP